MSINDWVKEHVDSVLHHVYSWLFIKVVTRMFGAVSVYAPGDQQDETRAVLGVLLGRTEQDLVMACQTLLDSYAEVEAQNDDAA